MELSPGTVLPDLELPDHAGRIRRLSELVGGDPTVIQFYRGWWCPKEQQFLQRLLTLQDEAEVAYTGIVSISVDAPVTAAAFRAGAGARWTFLSDHERRYLDALRLREVGDTVNHPYLPVVLVIDPALRIHRAYNGYWFWGRPTAEELRQDLRAVSQEIRPDWEPPRS